MAFTSPAARNHKRRALPAATWSLLDGLGQAAYQIGWRTTCRRNLLCCTSLWKSAPEPDAVRDGLRRSERVAAVPQPCDALDGTVVLPDNTIELPDSPNLDRDFAFCFPR